MTSLTRREFMKSGIAAATAATVGVAVTQEALAQARAVEAGWSWDKGVCRFCGTGCGIQIATKGGQIVAVKGDPDAPVNRGLNCIKGYFNGRILYGQDRLTKPLMRMKNGAFDKKGDFVPVTWERALDEMERQARRALAQKGPTGIAMIPSGQSLIQEGYVAAKLMKAGFRSNNIDPNARLCMASAVAAFIQTFGIDEPANNYDDIEQADAMILWGANMAEAHPVLWSRITDRQLTAKATRIVNVTTYANMSSDLADLEIVMKPNADLAIQNYISREIIARNAVNREFVDKHCVFATGPSDIGYGMRPTAKYAYEAEKDVQAQELVHTLDKYEAVGQRRQAGEKVEQKNRASSGRHWLISFDDFRKGVEPYTLDFVAELAKGDPDEPLDKFKAKLVELVDLYVDPKRNVLSFWTMGFNQNIRGVWLERAVLRQPPAARQARAARQRRVLAHRPAVGLRHRARGRDLRPPAAGRHGRRQPGAPRGHREAVEAAGQHAEPQGRQRHHGHPARHGGRRGQVRLDPDDEPVPVDAERQPLAEGGARDGQLRRRRRGVPDGDSRRSPT